MGTMNWDAYEDIDVAIREMDDEDDDEREAPRKTKFRLERAVCPRCRMLLSVVAVSFTHLTLPTKA